jgi:AraC-like DNA-binding protein
MCIILYSYMKIIVKNMVCPCCELQLRRVLEEQGLKPEHIKNGELTLAEYASPRQLALLDQALRATDLGLLEESENSIVEKVKGLLNILVNTDNSSLKINISHYLSKKLGYNYSYLSNLFSQSEGQTIRDYGIFLRIERAKRMLCIEKMDLPEISVQLRYSSISHLATQFKKITGMTTSEYVRAMKCTETLGPHRSKGSPQSRVA